MILTVTANPTVDRVYFLDSFEFGKVHRVDSVARSAGGKGINVARVAGILGRKTAAMGFTGGYTGDFIKSEVEAQGIANLFTDISGESRTCVNISNILGKSGEILECGPEISDQERKQFIDAYRSSVKDYDIICVSGSMPRGLAGDFYIELTNIAKQSGKKIIVDTSGNALCDVLSAAPFMVKPNGDEISELMGKEIKTDSDIKKALLFLLEKGIEVPFVSLGKDGAAALVGGSYYKFMPPCVKAKNTVGSGDSTVAGIAAGLDSGFSVSESIKLGMACGAANTQFEKTGFVSKELVEEFFPKVTVVEF